MSVKESAKAKLPQAPRSKSRTHPSGNLAQRSANRHPGASESYLALARAYPIHPIRSEEDLDEAIEVLDRLQSRIEPLDSQEQDYLDSLGNEIERYEASAHPMPAVSGADMLRHLLDAHDTTISEAAQQTGIALSTLSAVLNNKRKLALTHIQVLAARFGVEPAAFLD